MKSRRVECDTYEIEQFYNGSDSLIRVYKQRLLGRIFGQKLVGWVDDSGTTYDAARGGNPVVIEWSFGKNGKIYEEHGSLRGLVGWVREDGAVFAKYGRPYGTYAITAGVRQYSGRGFEEALVFWVRTDGTVYGRRMFGTKLVGTIDGTDLPPVTSPTFLREILSMNCPRKLRQLQR